MKYLNLVMNFLMKWRCEDIFGHKDINRPLFIGGRFQR